ncbi:MAG: SDR family oxidoreductase [Candidatus Woesearchaeota archaeon]
MKHIVITGGSNGIGWALVKELYDENTIYILDMTEPQAKHKHIRFIKTNISDEKDVAQAFKQIPKVDILINNAGVMRRGALLTSTISDYDLLFNVNLKGSWIALREAHHKLTKDAQVIQMSSRHGVEPKTDPALYSLTKYSVEKMARLFEETYKVTTKIASPGPVLTNLSKEGYSDEAYFKRTLEKPENIAKKIVMLINSNKRRLLFNDKKQKYYFKRKL